MSEPEKQEPRSVRVEEAACQLALRRAIEDVLDDLIIAGADKVTLLKENRRRLKLALSRSQVKNVANQAAYTHSREDVTNFVRYQMGRRGGDAWRHRASPRLEFGREIIADIEGIEGRPSKIDQATTQVCAKVRETLTQRGMTVDEAALECEARARLTALYLGYLNRTYAYCEAMDDKEGGKVCWDDVARIAGRKEGT